MKCQEFEERVSAYLEEELTPARVHLFEQHAICCSACCQTLEGVRAASLALRRLGAVSAPARYRLRVRGNLEKRLHCTSLWLRSLAFGLTLVIVLAIVLWPQNEVVTPSVTYPAQTYPAQKLAARYPVGVGAGAAGVYSIYQAPRRSGHIQARRVSY